MAAPRVLFVMLWSVAAFEYHATKQDIGGVPVYNWDPNELSALDSNGKRDWLLIPKEAATNQQVASVCKDAEQCDLRGRPQEGEFGFIKVHASAGELEDVAKKHVADLEFIEPDAPIEIFSSPVEIEGGTSLLEKVDSRRVGATGKGVHVYNVDTGIKFSHTEFESRAIPTIDTSTGELKKCDESDYSCAADEVGHGTHVAGIIGGKTAGVAKDVTLHAVKVMGKMGRLSNIIMAVDWVTKNAKKPALMSFAMGSSGKSVALKTVTEKAAKKGIPIVGAAGNGKKDACDSVPGSVKAAVIAGAVDADNKRAFFSNYGECVDGWGPGMEIESAGFSSDTAMAKMSGTSMSCAHVSGKAAIFLEEDPNISPGEIEELLKKNSEEVEIGDVDGMGGSAKAFLLYGPKDKDGIGGGSGGDGVNSKTRRRRKGKGGSRRRRKSGGRRRRKSGGRRRRKSKA